MWMTEVDAKGSLDLWIGCIIEDGGIVVCPGQGDTLFVNWKHDEPSRGHGEYCIRMIEKNGGKWADMISLTMLSPVRCELLRIRAAGQAPVTL